MVQLYRRKQKVHCGPVGNGTDHALRHVMQPTARRWTGDLNMNLLVRLHGSINMCLILPMVSDWWLVGPSTSPCRQPRASC